MHDLLKPGLGFTDNKGDMAELDGKSLGETADGVPLGNTHSACTFQLTKPFLETTTNTHQSEPRMSASPLFPARVDDQARTFGKNGSCKTEPYVLYEIRSGRIWI